MRKTHINMIAWTIVWIGVALLAGCALLRIWMQLVIPLAVPCVIAIACGLFLMWVGKRYGK